MGNDNRALGVEQIQDTLAPRPQPLAPDYVVIGHICADLQPDGATRLGGTALFAALTAYQLGLRVAVLTACAPPFDLSTIPHAIAIVRQPSPVTTIFENRYAGGQRTQFLHARAIPIDLAALPPAWRDASIVHLAPIMREVPIDTDWRALFPDALIAATPQGWLREATPPGMVRAVPQRLVDVPLHGVDVVVLSEEDVAGDEALVWRLARHVPLVTLTRAERGATLIRQEWVEDIPAFPATVIDPTGAGDVFTAAFLHMLQRSGDARFAARWACAAAAFAIEAPGVSGLPDAAQVAARVNG